MHATGDVDSTPDPALIDTQRQEALALFQANQAARSAAARAYVASLTIGGAALVAGVNAETWAVVLPVPALLLLVLAHMFQQYTDLTVIGMARLALERRVNTAIGGPGLIYETAVAGATKEPPLVWSVRALQIATGAVVVAVIAAGAIAAQGENAVVIISYALSTLAALGVAGLSFLQMLDAEQVAKDRIQKKLDAEDQRLRHS